METMKVAMKSIDAGVGEIRWKSDNFDLEMLMESLEARIKKDGYKSVMRLLEYDKTPE